MLKGVKTGDKLYSANYGEVEVYRIEDKKFVFKTRIGDLHTCSYDGFLNTSDNKPTVFRNIDEAIEHLQSIAQFNLYDELKKIKVIPYYKGGSHRLFWDNVENRIATYISFYESPGDIYLDFNDVMEFLAIIKDKPISRDEFFKAYTDVFLG